MQKYVKKTQPKVKFNGNLTERFSYNVFQEKKTSLLQSLYYASLLLLFMTILPITIHSQTDPIVYGSIDHFVKIHRDTPTKVFSDRKFNHLTHFFLVGVVVLVRGRLGNFWVDIVVHFLPV